MSAHFFFFIYNPGHKRRETCVVSQYHVGEFALPFVIQFCVYR